MQSYITLPSKIRQFFFWRLSDTLVYLYILFFFFRFVIVVCCHKAGCCWFKLILWFIFFMTISIHCSYPRWFNRFTDCCCCCYCSCYSREKIQIYIQALLSSARNTITRISMCVCVYDIVLCMRHVIHIVYRIVFCVANVRETKTTIKIKRTLCACVKR